MNAEEYLKEAARDAIHAVRLPAYFAKTPGFSFDDTRNELIKRAEEDGIDKIENGYSKVVNAAQAIGKREQFINTNKLYSKFAHAGPFRIVAGPKCEEVRTLFYESGKQHGRDTLGLIQLFISTGEIPQ